MRYGLPDNVYLKVVTVAGLALTERMRQAGVDLPAWFRQPQPAYANKTPAQLVRAGRTGELIHHLDQLEQQRRNGNGEH